MARMALPDRDDLYRGRHVLVHADRQMDPVGRIRLLPDELRLAGDDGGGGDLRRLGLVENKKLRPDVDHRLDVVRVHLVGVELRPTCALPTTGAMDGPG